MFSVKKSSQIPLLLIILIFTTKFFQSTPFETLFFQLQAVFLGFVLIWLVFYVLDIFNKKKLLNGVILYFLFLMLFMPLYSAYRAHAEFGQPYLYGIASQRSWVILGVGIWFYYMLYTKKMAISTVESSFLFMAWGSLIVFTLFAIFFDPNQLTGEENFARVTNNRGLRFKFQTFFITFGSLYYFIKHSIHKRIVDLLILFMFLAYVAFVIQGRAYIVFLVLIFVIYYYFNYSLSRFTINSIKVVLLVFSILMLLQAFMPDYIERMSDLFAQMFVVLGGEESNDASSNARIWQSLIAFDYFDSHPLSFILGTGKVSNQWNDGYETLFGHFYPSDIGLLGGVFLYGLLGLFLLLVIPLILEIKEIRKAKATNYIFIITIKYMLIHSILNSVRNGLYFGANIWIVIFFILFVYNRLNRRNHVSE